MQHWHKDHLSLNHFPTFDSFSQVLSPMPFLRWWYGEGPFSYVRESDESCSEHTRSRNWKWSSILVPCNSPQDSVSSRFILLRAVCITPEHTRQQAGFWLCHIPSREAQAAPTNPTRPSRSVKSCLLLLKNQECSNCKSPMKINQTTTSKK